MYSGRATAWWIKSIRTIRGNQHEVRALVACLGMDLHSSQHSELIATLVNIIRDLKRLCL